MVMLMHSRAVCTEHAQETKTTMASVFFFFTGFFLTIDL